MFFFCKQKTAYEMRISDWSSDVCSSDLKITTGQIYWGAVPFVFIQILMVALVLIFPGMVTHFLDRGPKLDPAAVMQQLELPTPDYGGDDSRSEERRVGKECVRTCRSLGLPDN